MKVIDLKNPAEIEKMRQGGQILKGIKRQLKKAIRVGVSSWEIEELAQQ